MKIQIKNKNSIFEVFNFKYLFNYDDIEFNKKIEDTFLSEKFYVIGNELLKNRKGNLKIHIAYKTESQFLNKINEIYEFFYKDNKPFILQDLDNNRECEIDILSIKKIMREGTEFIFSTIEIDFALLDAMFFDISETEVFINVNNTNIVNTNININSIFVFPIYEIQLNQSINDFFIQGEREFIRINTNNYTANDKLIIDSKNGEVYIEKTNSKIDLSGSVYDGGFVLLYKNNNDLSFAFNIASSGSIKIKYKNRYIL